MAGLKQIMYGVTDFALMRAENAYFVDYAHRFDELFGGLKIVANPTDERVVLDIHYILNWSPWMGLFIVYRMIAAVCLMMGSC